MNTNDLRGAMQKSVEAGATFYRLTYKPSNAEWNGSYRNISIHLVGRFGNLEYRRGYFATASPKTPFNTAATEPLAADSPELTGVVLRANLTPTGVAESYLLQLTIGPAGLLITDGPDKLKHVDVTLAYAVIQDYASAKPTATRLILRLDKEDYSAFLRNGISVHQHLRLPSDHGTLRISVTEDRSKAVGTLNIPLLEAQAPTKH